VQSQSQDEDLRCLKVTVQCFTVSSETRFATRLGRVSRYLVPAPVTSYLTIIQRIPLYLRWPTLHHLQFTAKIPVLTSLVGERIVNGPIQHRAHETIEDEHPSSASTTPNKHQDTPGGLPIPKTIVEKVEPENPSHGEVPGKAMI